VILLGDAGSSSCGFAHGFNDGKVPAASSTEISGFSRRAITARKMPQLLDKRIE
jgi:hypothetical protein